MKLKFPIQISVFILFLFPILSCDKTVLDEFSSAPISSYIDLTVGKYITYRLDSTVLTNSGRSEEIHAYQVRHMVDAQITDNLGRPSYRIVRQLRDSAGTSPWIDNGTYLITPLQDQLEVVEDNLRFIKLHIPFNLKFKWKGNRYISSDPYSAAYSFSNDDNMEDWDYTYAQFEASTSIGGRSLSDVYTITQIDESLNAPVTNINSYGARNYSVEKYAKNVGLVSREYILWEYQPNTGMPGGGYKIGFGIKMWVIDFN
jgi:hypothetical protein